MSAFWKCVESWFLVLMGQVIGFLNCLIEWQNILEGKLYYSEFFCRTTNKHLLIGLPGVLLRGGCYTENRRIKLWKPFKKRLWYARTYFALQIDDTQCLFIFAVSSYAYVLDPNTNYMQESRSSKFASPRKNILATRLTNTVYFYRVYIFILKSILNLKFDWGTFNNCIIIQKLLMKKNITDDTNRNVEGAYFKIWILNQYKE